MRTARKMPKKKGGRRPGSGRRMLSNEKFWGHMSRDTRVKLDRYARSIGIQKEARKCFWDRVLTALLGKVDLPEPEYLTLARAITVRQA